MRLLIIRNVTAFLVLLFFANTLQAQRVDGDYVVVLHGIARSSAHMKPLAAMLKDNGYDVINMDYPSTEYSLEELVEILHGKLSAALTYNKPVHFVGYSMGGLLARAYIHRYRPENLGRVVLLGTPNHGSEVADFLENNWLYKKIYGPAGAQLTTHNKEIEPLLGTVNYELGVIAGNSTIDPISSYLIDGDDDGKVSMASTQVAGMQDYTVIHVSHTFFPGNEDVHQQVVYFLKNGVFQKDSKK